MNDVLHPLSPTAARKLVVKIGRSPRTRRLALELADQMLEWARTLPWPTTAEVGEYARHRAEVRRDTEWSWWSGVWELLLNIDAHAKIERTIRADRKRRGPIAGMKAVG